MHSSRMRTVRNSSRLRGGGVPGPGAGWRGVPMRGVYLVPGEVYLVQGVYLVLGGCTYLGVYLVPGGVPGPGVGWWGVPTRGCSYPGGVDLPRGVPAWGVYLVPGDGGEGVPAWGVYLPRYSPHEQNDRQV